jgi:hypothetical protein
MPPQPEELKPFLVHGAIVDGKVQGSYISIVRCSGADSIPITAQQIHSTLAPGGPCSGADSSLARTNSRC